MKDIVNERMTTELDGDEVVVMLIGMRINRWWKIWSWLSVALAMRRMLRELEANPGSGLLAKRFATPGLIVQYWRSFQELNDYATNRSAGHYPAWASFNRKLAKNGDVGIWHETYVVPVEQIECIYHHMPPAGLGSLGRLVPATGRRRSARQRMGRADGDRRPAAIEAPDSPGAPEGVGERLSPMMTKAGT